MNTTGAFALQGILFEGVLFVVFLGYVFLSFSEGRTQLGVKSPQKFAGIFSLILGVLMIGAWCYFLVTRGDTYSRQFLSLRVPLISELIAAVSLSIAGVAMIR